MLVPDITIITALGTGDAYLLPGLYKSLLDQRGIDWEWIVSEDGDSGDGREVLSGDDRIVHLFSSPQSQGPAMARNNALGQARARCVRNLDADDRLAHPHALKEVVDAVDAGAGFVVSPVHDVDEDGVVAYRTTDLGVEPGLLAPDTLGNKWRRDGRRIPPVHPTTLAARTDAALALGGWSGLRYGEDTALMLRLDALYPGYLLAEAGTLYARRPGQVTARSYNGSYPPDYALYTDFIDRSISALTGTRGTVK